MMYFDVLTLFPEMFPGPLGTSILKRAMQAGQLGVRLHNFRDYAHDRHHTVDDYPYGGGAGMVLKAGATVRGGGGGAGAAARPRRACACMRRTRPKPCSSPSAPAPASNDSRPAKRL